MCLTDFRMTRKRISRPRMMSHERARTECHRVLYQSTAEVWEGWQEIATSCRQRGRWFAKALRGRTKHKRARARQEDGAA